MSREILDNYSFQLLRTNPKITSNVKLVVNSQGKLFLESFDANSQLSASEFKAYEIGETSSYSQDVFNFYQRGQFPKNLAFGVKQESSNEVVGESYTQQYDMTYSSGAEVVTSTAFDEDFSFLAPLWLDQNLPDAFVIFRLNGPLSVNEVNSTVENSGNASVSDASQFSNYILNNSVAIKTFDLSQNSKLGKYLRAHINDPNYPPAPFEFQYDKNTPVAWHGISYSKGGFASGPEYDYEQLITEENSIIETEYFITTGFERTGIICANLINLQFLFSDPTANNYEINRYFGLYVNRANEGSFRLDGKQFYYGAKNSGDQTVPPTTNYINDTLSTSYDITNSTGVVLYYDPLTLVKNTAYYDNTVSAYTQQEVQTVNSFFYVSDKDDSIYEIKRGSGWGQNELRLSNTTIDISKFVGFDDTSFKASADILNRKGRSSASFTVLAAPPDGFNVFFYRANVFEGSISGENTIIEPGTASSNFFSVNGTAEEVAIAMYDALNSVSPDSRSFDVYRQGATLYFLARFTGSRGNEINIRFENFGFDLSQYISSFPGVETLTGDLPTIFYTGGTDWDRSRIRIKQNDVAKYEIGKYLKTDTGYAIITSISLYVDEATRNSNFIITSIPNVSIYYCINTDNKNLILNSVGEAILYELFVPKFGRLSVMPVKDFDFDFFSTQYGDLGELEVEEQWYTDPNNPLSYHPDIINFYNNGGFAKLQPILPQNAPTIQAVNPIYSEYDRLNENFTKELAINSRVVPYINKWSFFDFGTDTRYKPYRLDFSKAFGNFNFAPVAEIKNRDANALTHEWYLLSKIPDYFTAEDAKRSWSYFSQALTEAQIKDTSQDNFKNYFIVDNLTLYTGEQVAIDKQLRYADVGGGNADRFAQTFFRGSKLIFKQRATSSTALNFDTNSTSFVKNERFNDYRFSTVLIPSVADEPNFKIKFIENRKWKTVTMFIYLYVNEECFDLGENIVDRTMLYALNSKITPTTGCDFQTVSGSSIVYGDPRINGALDPTYAETTPTGLFKIRGQVSTLNGSAPNFLREIIVNTAIQNGNLTGQYPDIIFTIPSGSAAGDYRVFNINEVLTENLLTCQAIQKWNGSSWANITWPPVIGANSFRSAELFLDGAGFNAFADRFRAAGYGNILDAVNQGDPTIEYITVNSNGTESQNEFAVELVSPNALQKPIYLTSIQDPDKPVQFNLVDTVGYRLFINSTVSIIPFFRHFGFYNPIFKDIFTFEDPFVVSQNTTGSDYEQAVLNYFRYENTQFNLSDPFFGIIENYFYHKVNEQTPASVIQLSTQSAYKPVYPLISEVAIDFRDFYIFRSNWDPGYFVKNLSTGKFELKAGTRNQFEKKSFFASKVMKTPQSITLQTFEPSVFYKPALFDNNLVDGTVMYEGDSNPLTLDLYSLTNKAAIEFWYPTVFEYFKKYVNPAFSYSDEQTIEDDVISYIKNNILPVYQISSINLYIKKTVGPGTLTYSTLLLDNQQKLSAGLKVDKNTAITFPVPNSLDFQLIYNLDKGYDYSIGLSVTLSKK